MKFGKLSAIGKEINDVSFNLPPDNPANIELLGGQPKQVPQIYIGCPVWTCKEWIGKIYPAKTPVKKYLHSYARQFNAIELNTTHYGIPADTTIQKWCAEVPSNFRFCPKFHQTISHSKQLRECSEWINLTVEMCLLFGDKLGMPFLQLSPYFSPRDLPFLEAFLQEWPTEIDIAVEVRNNNWFASAQEFDRLAKVLKEYKTGFVITDTAGRQDVLHQTLTSNKTFVRFVANDLHASDFSRIDQWIERIGVWIEAGLEELWFFVHQPDEIHCPELISYFIKKLNQRLGTNIADLHFYNNSQQGTLF